MTCNESGRLRASQLSRNTGSRQAGLAEGNAPGRYELSTALTLTVAGQACWGWLPHDVAADCPGRLQPGLPHRTPAAHTLAAVQRNGFAVVPAGRAMPAMSHRCAFGHAQALAAHTLARGGTVARRGRADPPQVTSETLPALYASEESPRQPVAIQPFCTRTSDGKQRRLTTGSADPPPAAPAPRPCRAPPCRRPGATCCPQR